MLYLCQREMYRKCANDRNFSIAHKRDERSQRYEQENVKDVRFHNLLRTKSIEKQALCHKTRQ